MVKHPIILAHERRFNGCRGRFFQFKGKKESEEYEAVFQFFSKLKGSNIRQKSTDRRIELVIPKEEPKWWPRLLKESTKVPWIKINFDKWSDNKEEKDDEEEEEGGVDKLFQKIYRDADDDARKAMAKSFSESCGTVLSTNWSQVGAQKTEVKPPDGMEFKKYDE
uniref:SGS domain-containing protein n=1 Tax=Ditylenchus dipsaci TaxID=166011 RepID=A0A915D3F0_9BILA